MENLKENESPLEEKGKKRKRNITVLAIAGFAVILGTTGWVLHKKKDFTRVVQEDGSITLENTGDYDIVRDYELVEIETILGKNCLYLAQDGFLSDQEYYDIFSGKRISASTLETTVVKTTRLEDYLIAYGMLKENYTPEDLEELYQKISENYVSESSDSCSFVYTK